MKSLIYGALIAAALTLGVSRTSFADDWTQRLDNTGNATVTPLTNNGGAQLQEIQRRGGRFYGGRGWGAHAYYGGFYPYYAGYYSPYHYNAPYYGSYYSYPYTGYYYPYSDYYYGY